MEAGSDSVDIGSLMKSIFPVSGLPVAENILMPTELAKSNQWKSLFIVGPNQIQRSGLLLQAALTYAAVGRQVSFITRTGLNRLPPTTSGMPQPSPENMANISFKYCGCMQAVKELLIGYSRTNDGLLPSVIVINGLDDYVPAISDNWNLQFTRLVSLLIETTEYIGRRKKLTAFLFASVDFSKYDGLHQWPDLLRQWIHEVWTLEGNSNCLTSGGNLIRFTVLGRDIFLSDPLTK